MDDCCSRKSETLNELARGEQRRVLLIVMVINLAMFVLEFGGGLMARSSALMADSVDMFGDGVVYLLSLYALHRGPRWEAGAALAKGGIILAFGIAVIIEIAEKLAHGVPPSSTLMLVFGALALTANLTCLSLLWRFRGTNVNMASTFECSRDDVASRSRWSRRTAPRCSSFRPTAPTSTPSRWHSRSSSICSAKPVNAPAKAFGTASTASSTTSHQQSAPTISAMPAMRQRDHKPL